MSLNGSWSCSFSTTGVTVKGGEVCNNGIIKSPGAEVAVIFTTSKYIRSLQPQEKESFYKYMSYEYKMPWTGSYYVTVALVYLGKIDSYVTWDKSVYYTNESQKRVDEMIHELITVESDLSRCNAMLSILDGSEYLIKMQEKMTLEQRKYTLKMELVPLYNENTGEYKRLAELRRYEERY